MAFSTMALVSCLRDMLLVRRGLVLDAAVAEERARNIMAQLPDLLAATRCTGCGAQGTVDGDLCGRCFLAPSKARYPALAFPHPPRKITDEVAARIVRESEQVRREMEELTRPMEQIDGDDMTRRVK